MLSLNTLDISCESPNLPAQPERSQVGAGAPSSSSSSSSSSSGRLFSNTNLLNFVSSSGLSLSDAQIEDLLPKTVRLASSAVGPELVQPLYLGADTTHWSYKLTDEQFDHLHTSASEGIVNGLDVIAMGNFEEVGLSRMRYPYAYRVTTEDGMAWHIPAVKTHPLMVIVGPDWLSRVNPDEIDRDAWCWTCELMGQPGLGDTNCLSLSRQDIALDVMMPEKQFQKLCNTVKMRHNSVICRAEDQTDYTKKQRGTGFTMGKNAIVLRCYDKTLDSINKGKLDFWQKMWNNPVIPDDWVVVRFEFQQRREFLRSFKSEIYPEGIRTYEQYKKSASLVLLYLTQSWFRLAGRPQGEGHYRVTTRFWQAISNAFVTGKWYDNLDIMRVWRDVRRFVAKDPDRCMSMAIGCLVSYAAILGAQGTTGAAFSIEEVFEDLEAKMKEDDIFDVKAIERMRKIIYNLPR